MEASAAKRRWFLPTPTWLVYAAAIAAGMLAASERWRWFAFNEHKGWTVLLAVAVVAAALILILAWMLVAFVLRRRVQFGLRMLLVFVTLCALVCSWLGVRIKQARQQAEVVATIEGAGHGGACYDWESDNEGNSLPAAQPPGTQPLRDLLGVDFFSDIIFVRVWPVSAQETHADLANVARLTRLKGLEICHCRFGDTEGSQLEELTHLSELCFTNTRVTEEGVRKVQRALPACKIDVRDVIPSL